MYNIFGDFMKVVEKIEKRLNEIRPYLINDGGDVEFVKFEDGIVYIKMLGACEGCSLIDYTIKEGIEEFLVNEIPEVKGVKQTQ